MADTWLPGVLAQFLAMPPPANWTAQQWQISCRAAAVARQVVGTPLHRPYVVSSAA